MPTIEDASHCPKCDTAGKQVNTSAGPNGSQVFTYACVNERCRWYGEAGWIVQVRADGTIPERKAGPKQYTPLTPDQEATMRRVLEQNKLDVEGAE